MEFRNLVNKTFILLLSLYYITEIPSPSVRKIKQKEVKFLTVMSCSFNS